MHEEFDGVQMTLYENRIFHMKVPRLQRISMELVEKGTDFITRNGGGRYFNIFEFASFSDVEPDVREWAADSDGNHYTHTDAIVIGSLSQKIITDFYLRFNKPSKPTRVFYSLEKATHWTFEQMKKIDDLDY